MMDWSMLPEPVVAHVFDHLPFPDRCRASMTCKQWQSSFSSPLLWEKFDVSLNGPVDAKLMTYILQYGHLIKHISVRVDQSEKGNRENACELLSSISRRRLRSVSVKFTGENPMFYAGPEFLECFKLLFNVGESSQLRSVDLSGVKISITEDVIDILSENNPTLEKLNIQHDALICKISPNCVIRLLGRCKRLNDLVIFSCSISDEVMRILIDTETRAPMEHLGLMCRREQKFVNAISSECWRAVIKELPELRVTLGFDSTCPLDIICDVCKPEIPVRTMVLAVYGPIEEEVHYAPIYYSDTLETLTLHPLSNQKFHVALVEVARRCKKLRTLKVYCVLPQEVIQKIVELCPEMISRGTYILKSTAEPEPNWVMAVDARATNG